MLQIIAFVEFVRSHLPANQFQTLFRAFIGVSFVLGFSALIGLTLGGVIAPWTGRFYSLWDTDYAAKYIPIIASVSEHQPTPWTSWFFDLQWLIFLFPAGVYLCFKELRDEHVFVILYAVTASYFSSVMVRLMLTLTPIVCVGAALALSTYLSTYLRESPDDSAVLSAAAAVVESPTSPQTAKVSGQKKDSVAAGSSSATAAAATTTSSTTKSASAASVRSWHLRIVALVPVLYMCAMFAWHCTYVTSSAYSSPSVVLASRNPDGSQYIIDDFREAYYWLRRNTPPGTKVMSWWDYGYQIAGMADRTTLVDNNTWNNTHIATVGKAMASREEVSYPILRKHDVDYVLVIYGGVLGYSGDDINKFLWMIRISQGIWPKEVHEPSFFTSRGEYRVGQDATETMRESLMYKMSYYGLGELYGGGMTADRVRGEQVPTDRIRLTTLEEAYSSEHFIVRIYKVKDLDPLGHPYFPDSKKAK